MDEGSDVRRAEMLGFEARLFERMRSMHRAWIAKAQEIRDLELNCGSKLMAANNPSQGGACPTLGPPNGACLGGRLREMTCSQ